MTRAVGPTRSVAGPISWPVIVGAWQNRVGRRGVGVIDRGRRRRVNDGRRRIVALLDRGRIISWRRWDLALHLRRPHRHVGGDGERQWCCYAERQNGSGQRQLRQIAHVLPSITRFQTAVSIK